jgi:hypothetical protein
MHDVGNMLAVCTSSMRQQGVYTRACAMFTTMQTCQYSATFTSVAAATLPPLHMIARESPACAVTT